MPQGKGKRTSDKIHAVFPDELGHGGKKSSAKSNLMPQSLSKAWMRCAEGFDGCQTEKSFRSSERKTKNVQLLSNSFEFAEVAPLGPTTLEDLHNPIDPKFSSYASETSADESLKDPSEIVWSSSDNDLSNDGSSKTISQPDIVDISPQSACRSQDIQISFSNDRSSGGDVPQITDWQDDSDLECGHVGGIVSEAAESEVEISDSESVSSDMIISRRQHDVLALKFADIVDYSSDDPPDESTVSATRADRLVGDENSMQYGGKSASDWLKTAQVMLQTPKKKADVNSKTPEDSAKKKKRFLRGGLAERLNRLHNRERSAITFWRHQQGSDCKIPLGDKSGTLILKILEVHEECSVQVALCEQMSDIQNDDASCSKDTTKLTALFTKQTAAQLRLGPNDTIHIYPPWWRLSPPNQNTSVIISTHFSQRIMSNPIDEMENKKSSINMMSVKKRLVPLSLTLKIDFCSLGVSSDKQQISDISSHSQALVSVQGKEFTSSFTVNDSLLDIVETQGAAGWKDACIHVVIQRVYHLTSKDAPCSFLHTKNIKTIVDPSANLQRPDCRMGLLIQDAYGMFSELQVQFVNTAIDDMREYCQTLEGKACRLLGIKVLQRITRGRAPGLFSLIDSLWPPLIPIKIHGYSQVQVQIQSNLPGQRELQLYVTDSSLQVASETLRNPRILKVCILPSCVLDKTLQEIFSKKSLCSIFFKDAVKENGGIICVERTVLSLQKPPLSCTSGISELTGPVRLAELDSSTEANTLCTVKGIVIGVNDRESYSWPVCNLCGSNKLRPLTPKRCQFYCCQCSSDVSSPVIRRQLEVFLQCQGRPQCKVRLKLREETISSVLGSCASEDGRYEVTAVLGKDLGPVHCYVQCGASMVSLQEISLLPAGSGGDQ
ncbi:DNA repair-scaffolding protein isoform X2 [Phyllobates terribilis]|uniref:DNA repair-scaffolding protein isoform X2 n=1 Tax=Phyllobates terribilis TaxID=111132 RepID=UPI003CCABED0